MKEHSHCNTLYEMFKARPYILLKDLRWCNHRSRISDLRPRLAMEGLTAKSFIIDGLWAYKLVPLEKKEEHIPAPIQVQADLFAGVN